MTLKESIEVVENIIKNNKVEYCESQKEFEEEQQALTYLLGVVKRVDVEKIYKVLANLGREERGMVGIGMTRKIAQAICEWLEGKE